MRLRYPGQMGAGSPREQVGAATMHSSVNWALLGLVIERPSYAYELARRFERTYDGALSLSSVSHIYTALGTLRERGLVEDIPGTPHTVRSRRCYQATTAGIAEHAEWLVGQVAEERRRQRVLMAQLGALARTPARAIAALDAYEQACIAEMADAPPAGANDGPGTTPLVARLIGEETRLTIAARLRWAYYARAQLQALAATGPETD
jgi:DNA-binding PadR family transcriptional regulator